VRRWRRDEAGFNLIEVLMTILIMGIAMAALLTGLLTAISKTDFERKDALIQTGLRDYAENIKQAVLSTCPQNGTGPSWTVLSPDRDTNPSSADIKSALNRYGITLTASPTTTNVSCPTSFPSTTLFTLSASTAFDDLPSSIPSTLTIAVSVP